MFSSLFAQKIDKNITDDFTGKKMVTTKWESLTSSLTSVIQFRFRYENDKTYFELVYRNGVDDSMDEGNAIEFKTRSGVFELTNDRYVIIISNQRPAEILRYTGDMNFFLNSYIEKIRLHFNGGYDGFDLKPKKAELIGRAYKLLLSNIPT